MKKKQTEQPQIRSGKIGYAYVVGDILHEGHLLALENCKALCDKLIVGVLTDEATMEKKPRPTIDFRERLRLVRALKFVDAVVAQETYSPMSNVRTIKPDILFESDSHNKPGKNPYGETQVMPYFPIQSSTRIKNKIRNEQANKKMPNITRWQKRILTTAWITYASFYLLRVNMSVAIPGIIQEFGLSKTQMGSVLTALFMAYAAGQFINGQFGDNFSAKKLVGIGLFTSTLINFIFGYTNGVLVAMILLWGLNGFFQSMGWAPTVKIVASWFPVHKRGKASGILGSSYQIGNAASWLLAGFVAGHLGWRFVFWVPTVFTLLILIGWVNRLKEKAEDKGFAPVEIARKTNGFRDTIGSTVRNKKIWTVALGLFGLNIVRYGFLDWAPTYFFEVQKAHISTAAYKAIIFPLAGSVGSLTAGWISDKFFRGRRAPMAVVMLVLLGLFSLYFPHIPQQSWILSLVVLAIIGFLTFGPHMIMVTALPMDLGTKEMAASATGFIDGWGYIGASLTGVGTGFLLDRLGWNAAFYFWVSGAFLAALLMTTLWNHRRLNNFDT